MPSVLYRHTPTVKHSRNSVARRSRRSTPRWIPLPPRKPLNAPLPLPFTLAVFDDQKKVITESVSSFIAYDLFINLMIGRRGDDARLTRKRDNE